MKRIYLLMILFVAFAGNAFAQRSVDMRLLHYWVDAGGTATIMKNGDKVFANAQGNPGQHPEYQVRWMFKCLGPVDTLNATDTIYFRNGFGTTQKGTLTNTNGVGLNDSVYLTSTRTAWYPGQGITASGTQNINFCDSMWVVQQGGTIVADPMIANNKHCSSLETTFWLTGIEEALIMPNIVGLYPNPATNNLMMKYNFTEPAKAVMVQISDVTGKVVSTQQFDGNYSGMNNLPLNITQLRSGMYFLKMTTDSGNAASAKFTIQE